MKAIDAVIAISKALDGWDGTPEQAAEKLGAAVAIVKAYAATPAPEPRTCETCARGCLPNERVYVNPDAEDPCPGWTHRSPQSANIETARVVLKRISELLAEKDVTKRTYYEEMALEGVDDALRALDPRRGVMSRYAIEEFNPVDGYFNLISRDGKLLAKSYALEDARTIIWALERAEASAATSPDKSEAST